MVLVFETPVGDPGGSPAPVMTVIFVATKSGAGKGTSFESSVGFSTVEGEGGGVGGGVGCAFCLADGLGGGVGCFASTFRSRGLPSGK